MLEVDLMNVCLSLKKDDDLLLISEKVMKWLMLKWSDR